MSKGKVRREQPLLFISQPKLDLPKAAMQQAYRTTKEKRKEEAAEALPEETAEEITETAVQMQKEEKSAEPEDPKQKKKGNFKDLSLIEKIDYCLNLPSQIPRMKCEIVTEETSIIGIIMGIEDDVIQVKSVRRPFKREIKLASIKDIKLLGF
ncbi:CotO family spore coat protein [Terribacillus sp. DMT04]|uniref:CotO family spore coat protein n=1 Tax=Terribacillus sp. DMT04 TaxID=2850441 RepID=UPI001C2CBAB5|nr:CotO family spore coat protein [Terribacillus sp. DMT04]QXE02740.1 spore coat CotO family protein [Terribacillus sp. DMT04]